MGRRERNVRELSKYSVEMIIPLSTLYIIAFSNLNGQWLRSNGRDQFRIAAENRLGNAC